MKYHQAQDQKMDCYHLTIFKVLLLGGTGAFREQPPTHNDAQSQKLELASLKCYVSFFM